MLGVMRLCLRTACLRVELFELAKVGLFSEQYLRVYKLVDIGTGDLNANKFFTKNYDKKGQRYYEKQNFCFIS